MDERNPKRDLVLAPSEYAYMQDVTKGIVKTYTGPTVINPTAQERPVVFDAEKKLFEPCALEAAVQQIAMDSSPFGEASRTGLWVREALTLERLEYAILVDENGKKRYERGPHVVFPEPTEAFITRDGARKFRAIELNEIQGLHIKVIAPYTEAGRTYREGDELFITGKETAIYFPREEHSLVRGDGHDKHFAVAVPAGEARYVMNRKTGEIRMVRGPAMLLPNPVDDVIVRRVLSDRECATWYPANTEALTYNRGLRQLEEAGARPGAVAEGEVQKTKGKSAAQQVAMGPASFEAVDRSNLFTKPRTLVFTTQFEGVPAVSVWVGYAVLVVDKQGRRRVEVGPKNLLLEYDETLEVIQLSTGTPKTSERLVQTVFLRVLNNKVSDRCVVETSDHVQVTLAYAMRVNFDGERARWFEVENYVKFLCDHVRSVLKGNAKKHTIEAFYAQSVDLIRDAILGKGEDRPGMVFPENGMHVTDVEILGVTIDDEGIAELLGDAQHEAVESNIMVLRATRGLELTAKREAISRGEAEARAETTRRLSELEVAATSDRLRVAMSAIQAELDQAAAHKQAAVARNAIADVDHAAQLGRQKQAAELKTAIETAHQALVLEALKAEVDSAVARFGAVQGGFSEALLALSNHEVLAKVAEAMSVQSFVGGKTLTDVIDKVFAGTPLAGLMDKVKARTLTNGHAHLPVT